MAERNLDSRGPNKFEPQTKAQPAPSATPGRTTATEKRKEAAAKRRREEAEETDDE